MEFCKFIGVGNKIMFNEFLCIDESISTNKVLQLSFVINTEDIKFGIELFHKIKQDHACTGILINLFIIHLNWKVYDKRH